MAMKKKPVTGMKDIMPEEMEIRDYVISTIKKVYKTYGFSSIETPSVEHIENLSSKQGGENEKLIFKILKRGEKLRLEDAKGEMDVVDGGLRYDLTVPLSRYYANHANDLGTPFKALQMGNVWRAERPQRGRFRQFMQCDIDILGEPSNLAEIELMLATSGVLGTLGFKKFTIRINDRRILKAMAAYSGFRPEEYDSVFIIIDKLDKIGMDGVQSELESAGYEEENIQRFCNIFTATQEVEGIGKIDSMVEILGDFLEQEVADGLKTIITTVLSVKEADFSIVFDPTLVRGMSYYTGPIYEIRMDEFGGSVGGGGRYDEMIGRFTGQQTPAVGFSIGFERIILLMLENNFQVPGSEESVALLIDKKADDDLTQKVFKEAKRRREQGQRVTVMKMKKNKKFQKEQLKKDGYQEIVEFFAD